MAKRSYHQYCGLAAAMDVVGERWAMLIVRDLEPGPRRFNDLFAGLTGISTDVLADRLRSLEAAGALRQRELRYPVRANVYELTGRGRELAGIGADLASWGQTLLPPPGTSDHRVEPRWALQSMAAGAADDVAPGEYEFVIDGDELTVVASERGAAVRYGTTTDHPTTRLTCSAAAFFTIARDPARAEQLPADAQLEGDPARLRELLTAMPLTVGAPVGESSPPAR